MKRPILYFLALASLVLGLGETATAAAPTR